MNSPMSAIFDVYSSAVIAKRKNLGRVKSSRNEDTTFKETSKLSISFPGSGLVQVK